jgi:hypothetical protein
MKKHLWKGYKRVSCGVLSTTLDPENLEDKLTRVTCLRCLKIEGRVLDIRKRKAEAIPKLDVFLLDAEGPVTAIQTVLWTRVFRELGDAEKFANKAARGLLGHTEEFSWKKRYGSWQRKVKDITLTITKHRVS